jgi:RNA polymerase sigma factor (sigma-70 family)
LVQSGDKLPALQLRQMLKLFGSGTTDRRSDEELLARYTAGGDLRYLGLLYERYMPMVYGVCLKILRDAGKSEDAVMSIFEVIAVKAREHRIESFRPWLYVLARNHCLMEWRKEQRRPTDLHDPAEMPLAAGVEEAFETELPDRGAQALEKCLAALAETQRRCVQLFYYEDKSYKEIAGLLSEALGTVRSHIQNGRRNLKICLEKQGVQGAGNRI